MTKLTRIWTPVASTLLVCAAAGGAVLTASPAGAETCTGAGGVSVVVDPGTAGGSVVSECVPGGGGKTAAEILVAAGHSLTWVQLEPGFLCRIDGVPAADPCVRTPPASAYWGVFWANGTTAGWKYASSGVNSLMVPEGGSLGLAFQSGTKTMPSVAPPVRSATTAVTTAPATAPSSPATPTPKQDPTEVASAPTSAAAEPGVGSAKPASTPTLASSAPVKSKSTNPAGGVPTGGNSAAPGDLPVPGAGAGGLGGTEAPLPQDMVPPPMTDGLATLPGEVATMPTEGLTAVGVPPTVPTDLLGASAGSPTDLAVPTPTAQAAPVSSAATEPTSAEKRAQSVPLWLVGAFLAGLAAVGVAGQFQRRRRARQDYDLDASGPAAGGP